MIDPRVFTRRWAGLVITALAGLAAVLGAHEARAQQVRAQSDFPVSAELLVDAPFRGSEGIAFNGEGRLFVTADKALWEISLAGEPRRIADLDSNLGLASIHATAS